MPTDPELDALPRLRWLSGQPFSEASIMGLLSLFACEAETIMCPGLRTFRQRLDPDSLNAFGQADAFEQTPSKSVMLLSFVPSIASSERDIL